MTGSNLGVGMLRFRIYRSDKDKVVQVSAAERRRTADREKKWRTNLGVGITKFDSDVPYELVFESDSHDARDGFYDCRFAVRDMSDRT